eukprot:5895967-Prymnesium_polylepis.1
MAQLVRDWISYEYGRSGSSSSCWADVGAWPLLKIEGPTQPNGFDCGMHLLVSAHLVVEVARVDT